MFIHETAVVDEGATIGDGTNIWHFSHIMSKATIGKQCNFGQNTFVANGVRIGDRVKVQNNVSLYEGVVIEDDVFLGPSCVFTNVKTPRAHVDRRNHYGSTHIERGVTIGANATIVCGIRIGTFAFIGAGAVVTADVSPHALMVGVPAVQKGWMCECGVALQQPNDIIECFECKKRYSIANGKLIENDA